MNQALVQQQKQQHFAAYKKPLSIGQGSKVRGIIQAKLKIGAPNDKYEQEADRVAEQVMRMPEPGLSSSVGDSSLVNSTFPHRGRIQRIYASCLGEYQTAEDKNRLVQPANHCPKCGSQEQRLVQTKQITQLVQAKTRDVTPETTHAISSGIQALQGSGRPLSELERRFFEPRFGADFSSVRVHNNYRAASVAQSVNARAFTVGHNVVFGAGEYTPEVASGKKLLAHELTHVVQQNQTTEPIVQRYTQDERDNCPCLDWSLPRMWAYAHSMVVGGALTGRDHASDFMDQFLDDNSSDARVPFSDVQGNQGGRDAINVVTNRLINKFVQAGEGLDCDGSKRIRRSASAPGHFSSGTDLFYAMGAFRIRASGSATVTKVCTEGTCEYIEIEVNISYQIDDLYDWKSDPGGCTPSTGESGCTANTKEVNLPVLGQICDECLNRLVIHDWAAEFMVKVRGRTNDYYDIVDCGDRYTDDHVDPRPEER